MTDFKFLGIFGAILLTCATSSTAFAANESTYIASSSAGAVLCSYNQRDTVYFVPYKTVLIPAGKSAKVGCNDGKPLFAKHRANSCRIRGLPFVTEQQAAAMGELKDAVSAMAGAGSPLGALWTAAKQALTIEHDLAKKLCKNLLGVINVMPYLGMVKKGSTVKLDSKGLHVQ